ncbi:hypothetical protein BGW38_004476 [Lunasporangiospora selenospora]|uniref:C2H2-type domain-containing protein n=1 Tax=Lunasporangiospora selenospora TaxID=979761 RepID=A0A9P6FPA2_9FUNG|nr:hypothetical protein BGW38_004476 [Lunasporangiospora selenospora]
MAAPVPSLSPMTPSDGSPVPAGMAPTLATMSSPMSPLTSLSTVSQGLILEDVMPYSYNLPHYQPQAYPFKHAGNARIPEQPTFITDSVQGASSPSHAYHSHSPDPSGSPPVFSTFPPRMNSLVDHSYALADSTSPAFYQGQSHLSSPYGVVPHSPISNGSYTPSYSHSDSLGSGFTAASPVTPHYGFSHIPDARYGPMPVYGDLSLQAQTTAQTGKPSKFRSRKSPYDRRTNDQGLSGAAPPPRRFQCPECEKAFPTKGELASHSRCHLKVPAFMCGICGRPFKRRTDYVRHVRNVHEEVGRYGCAQCGERFGRLDKLKRHDKRGCGADKEESQ